MVFLPSCEPFYQYHATLATQHSPPTDDQSNENSYSLPIDYSPTDKNSREVWFQFSFNSSMNENLQSGNWVANLWKLVSS